MVTFGFRRAKARSGLPAEDCGPERATNGNACGTSTSARPRLGISKSRGRTPITVVAIPSSGIDRPTMFAAPEYLLFQSSYEMMATFGLFGLSSSTVKSRPRMGDVPNVFRNVASTATHCKRMGLSSARSQASVPGVIVAMASNGVAATRQSNQSAESTNSLVSSGAIMPSETRRSSCGYGRLRNRIRSTALKTAVVDPMPSVKARSAASVNAGMRIKPRIAYRTSWTTVSMSICIVTRYIILRYIHLACALDPRQTFRIVSSFGTLTNHS
jgi:hypothetical protein